jgi:Cytochrome c554 and c-prime
VRFRDVEHVFRMAAVFAVVLVSFLTWRAWAVPDDFGVYGHYRARALAANMAVPLRYAGQASCLDCHAEAASAREAGRHAAIACESCHGPQRAHASGEIDTKPPRPDPRGTCLPCHAAGNGKAAGFPQVVIREHAATGACTACHQAHAPAIR